MNHHHYKIDHLSPRQISGGHDIIDLPSPCRTQHSGRKFKRFLLFQHSRISKRFLPTVHDPSQPRRFSVKKKFEAGARQRRGVEMLIEIPDDRRSIIIIMQLRRVLYHHPFNKTIHFFTGFKMSRLFSEGNASAQQLQLRSHNRI